ncbi:hypothetical protein AXF42_Ash013584 [Apostasia shenzhenica]|uniref:PHD-type domain-containing protein n=1 Tax=Apostasia shenzhenica TaxID=1088818 RepID=A0A2I0APB4_9ASPA|nr:hypothetical protein AXF42_Ash013584 [Apostasia shenzhenica]
MGEIGMDVIQGMASVISLPETIPSYLHTNNGCCPYAAEGNLFKERTPSLGSSDFGHWKHVELDGEYWDDALKILRAKQGNFHTEKCKLRKHLVSIGWRVESKRDAMIRYRYISPDGRTFYSFVTASKYLLKNENKNNKLHGTIPSNVEPFLPQLNFEILEDQQTAWLKPHVGSSRLLNSIIAPTASLEHIGDNAQIASSGKKYLDSQEVVIYEDSDIIATYMKHINEPKGSKKLSTSDIRVLRTKVKKHLLEKGWKFWLKDKKVRKELRYTSPTGKTYISLYTACKGCLKVPKMAMKEPSDKMNGEEFIHLPDNITPICSYSTTLRHLKALDVQQEGFDEGPTHSPKVSNSVDIGSNKHDMDGRWGVKRRKIECQLPAMILGRRSQTCIDVNCLIAKDVEKKDFHVTYAKGKALSRIASRRSGKRSRQIINISIRTQVAKTVLLWLIEKDVVLPRDKVMYIRKKDGRIMKKGYIHHDGIRCWCCQKVFSLSEFEAHAGEKTCRPSASIILRDCRSLLDCLKQMICVIKPKEFQHARLKSNFSDYEADYVCTVCQDGGTLLLCDLCPSAFHPTCIGLEDVPQENWFCPSCRCSICGLSEFNCNIKHFSENSGIYCDQCERQYHVRCLQKRDIQLRSCPTGTWTCSQKCYKIFHGLCSLLGKSNLTSVKGLSWTILKSSKEYISKLDDESIAENYGKLHIALDVLHECFQTMIEPRTQSDVAEDLIFNRISELNRLNFWGFYTMLLMKGDELVSVATFRVFGETLAEMPLIGTRIKFRHQGFCRLLMDELQKLLSSLGVRRLLLPAVPELVNTWITKFGFTKMTDSDKLELLEYTTLSFQDTTMCYKFLKKPTIPMF